ncbi:MAG: hypothetical protein ACON4U_01805 [Myxococcota bacterium]
MSMSLSELIEQHDALFYPEDIENEILDDLQFMVHDLDMQVLGFAIANLQDTPITYKPDMEHWARIHKKILEVDDLSDDEEIIKGRLVAWMQSLYAIVQDVRRGLTS